MKTNTPKKQQGFTLIELMIVVGIIGILSAIAVPAYQGYVLKTEANTAVGIPRALTANIDLFIQKTGKFPSDQVATDLTGIGAATDMSSLGLLDIEPTASGSEYGTILFSIGSTGALSGKKVQLTRSANGWSCKHDTGQSLKGCTSGTFSSGS
ncbi:pilin [Vibrio maerlii]|uniref:pilin n=1 Tax=Vibrio maerlii TaxID=2231648 RepID=UPI000E3B6915|nr:prepilin-type N-terminal cleavage/methylation domain-containing protein [Vibrio maerlii]